MGNKEEGVKFEGTHNNLPYKLLILSIILFLITGCAGDVQGTVMPKIPTFACPNGLNLSDPESIFKLLGLSEELIGSDYSQIRSVLEEMAKSFDSEISKFSGFVVFGVYLDVTELGGNLTRYKVIRLAGGTWVVINYGLNQMWGSLESFPLGLGGSLGGVQNLNITPYMEVIASLETTSQTNINDFKQRLIDLFLSQGFVLPDEFTSRELSAIQVTHTEGNPSVFTVRYESAGLVPGNINFVIPDEQISLGIAKGLLCEGEKSLLQRRQS